MIEYPNIDPVIFSLGPFAIRWYSLSYVVGIILACFYTDKLNKKFTKLENFKPYDDFLTWNIIGIILGGRIGYTLFYNFNYYINHPFEILMVWHGGMSFHGGVIGVICATYYVCRKNKLPFLTIADLFACSAPIGLFLGRIANFINGELYGRVTDVPWAMIFPNAGELPRHPSQIYEALLEGILLFIILALLVFKTNIIKYKGALSGLFLIGYALARSIVENYRQPDEQLGFIIGNITMGQILSTPMYILGFYLIYKAWKQK